VNWRQPLSWLGPIADGLRPRSGASDEPGSLEQPDAVETSEVALILLKNAIRLLDQSTAPPEIRTQLATAIREIEEYIAARTE